MSSTYLFDDAQQEFSAEGYPCLHLVLPAFEKLHAVLSKRLDDPAYLPFHEAIEASLTTIEKHYSRTERSDAYIICSGECSLCNKDCLRTNLDPQIISA